MILQPWYGLLGAVEGGGINVIGPTVTGQIYGAEITGISGNVLQLSEADATNPGILSAGTQVIPGLKEFPAGAAVRTYDVRNAGAVANDITNNLATAFYNAQAISVAQPIYPITIFPTHSVHIPEGFFYTDVPLCLEGEMDFSGVSALLSHIFVGRGGGGNVQPFCGPIVYASKPYNPTTWAAEQDKLIPLMGPPLVGATGQSLHLSPNFWNQCSQLFLHDAWPWVGWIGNDWTLTNFSLQFWLQIDSVPDPIDFAGYFGVIASRGPNTPDRANNDALLAADGAFGVYVLSNGTTLRLEVLLSTNPAYASIPHPTSVGIQHTITSSTITPGTIHHVELDYNGAFFDFYLDGINQGHVSAVGPIIRNPWEGVAIGGQGCEAVGLDGGTIHSAGGYIDSIRLSKVARHTGTGSFTPPTSKYAWDSDTYALYNWDQGWKTIQPKDPFGADVGPLLTLPFVIGQVYMPYFGGPFPHYIRLFSDPFSSADNHIHDFSIDAAGACSGLVAVNAYRTFIERIWVTNSCHAGIVINTPVSFYCTVNDVQIFAGIDVAIAYMGDCNRVQTQGFGIAHWLQAGGTLSHGYHQPSYQSFCTTLVDVVASGRTALFNIVDVSNDAEVWEYPRQIGVLVAKMNGIGTLHTESCFWDASMSSVAPIHYIGSPGVATHSGDSCIANHFTTSFVGPSPCSIASISGLPNNNITAYNCKVHDQNDPVLPFSDLDGWITQVDGSKTTNVTGLSISDVKCNNLAGTFTVGFGGTLGQVEFDVAEPDTNYVVNITPQGSVSATSNLPAAGSTRIASVTKSTGGFLAFTEADPGTDVTNTFVYTIIRIQPDAAYFNYLPTIPSTIDNPLFGLGNNVSFAAGMTAAPIGRNTFVYDTSAVNEVYLSAGDAADIGAANTWESGKYTQGNDALVYLGAVSTTPHANVSNGKLVNILNPGAHNIIFYFNGAVPFWGMDGATIQWYGLAVNYGTQPAHITIGQRSDASNPLTTATIRNLKIDRLLSRVKSSDSAIGPGVKPQGVFIGGQWTVGFSSSSGEGGFATRLAEIRYSTFYYWMCNNGGNKNLIDPLFHEGILDSLWKPWGGSATAPPLQVAVLELGFNDIVAGHSAADTWAGILQVLEGSPGTVTWSPPIRSPNQAVAYGTSPLSGSAALTIGGFSISFPFITDRLTSINAFIVAMAADVSINAIMTGVPYIDANSGNWQIKFVAQQPGSAGSGIVLTTDGGGGQLLYGDVGGQPAVAPSVQTFPVPDDTVTFGAYTFVVNFDTDATTTVDNLVADIAADPVASIVFTGTNTGLGTMLLTTNYNSYTANSVKISSNAAAEYAPGTGPFQLGQVTLAGGSNGLITSGVGTILLCNVPPIGTTAGYNGGKETQRGLLNTSINGYSGAGVTVMDLDLVMRDPSAHNNLLPAYDLGGGLPNDDGHTAVFNFLASSVPGIGSAPTMLSYATNPASYANGAPIATNSPTVTGSVTLWTVSPPLPAGLSISSSTGDVTGTPTTPTAAANYTVVASNASGSVAIYLNITIT